MRRQSRRPAPSSSHRSRSRSNMPLPGSAVSTVLLLLSLCSSAITTKDDDDATLDLLKLAASVSYRDALTVTALSGWPVGGDEELERIAALHRLGLEQRLQVFVQTFGGHEPIVLKCGESYVLWWTSPNNFSNQTSLLRSVADSARKCNREERGGGARMTHLTVPPSAGALEDDGAVRDLQKVAVLHEIRTSGNLSSLHDLDSGLVRCDTTDLSECSKDPHAVGGTTLRAVYDTWDPFFVLDDSGGFAGFMHDVFLIVALKLNISVEWVENPEKYVWGNKDEDGNWLGMIGQVARGEFDASAAGFEPRTDRAAVLDLSMGVCRLKSSLFVQAPSRARVSWENYLKEFDLATWTAIGATSIVLVAAFHFTLKTTWSVAPTAIVMRSLIGKGSDYKASSIPSKALHITMLLFATVIFVSYRSAMNAFLAIVIPAHAVANLADVLELTAGLTFWPGTSYEVYFQESPTGSVEKELHSKFAADDTAQVTSYVVGLDNVVERNYVLLAEVPVINKEKKYACQVSQVPGYAFSSTSFTIPFSLGSKYTRPFNEEILKLKNLGVVDRLLSKYMEVEDLNEGCQEGALGLGFSNVFTPFLLLAMGAFLGLALLLLEKLQRYFGSHSRGGKKGPGALEMDRSCRRTLKRASEVVRDDRLSERARLDVLRKLVLEEVSGYN